MERGILVGEQGMKLWAERSLPYAVGIGAGATWFVIRRWLFCTPVDFSDSLLSAGITYGSIAIGFLATTMAVTIGLFEAPLMKDIRRSHYIIELTQYMAEGIFFSLAAVTIGFVGFFPVSDSIGYQVCWFIAMVMSFVTLIRIAIVFLLILLKQRPK
jgi:hypothetical protein